MQIMTRTGALLAGAAFAATLLSGCGGSGTTTAVAAAAGTGTGGTSKAAYTACLAQHGVTEAPHSPGQGQPSAGASKNPQREAADAACASLKPAGNGNNADRGAAALTAFRNCMTQQGVTIPTTKPSTKPSANPSQSADARYLNGLNPSDPTVAAAVNACKALLPTRSPKASSSPTSTS